MNVNSEDGLSFYSRLRPRPLEEDLDPPLNSDRLISIIDLSETESDDCNAFVYFICKNVLDRHFAQSNESFDPRGTENCDQGALHTNEAQVDDPIEDSIVNSQRSLINMNLSPDGSQSSSSSDDSMEDSFCDRKPIIMVIDGLNCFDIRDFGELVTNTCQLMDMSYTNCYDFTQFMGFLKNELSFHLSLNPRLKLIITYAIPTFFRSDVVTLIVQQLSSLSIKVNVIVIVDKLLESQRNAISNNALVDLLKIKKNDSNRIEVKSIRCKNPLEIMNNRPVN